MRWTRRESRPLTRRQLFFADDVPLVRAAVVTKLPLNAPLALSMRQMKRPLVLRRAPASKNVASTRLPFTDPLTSIGVLLIDGSVRPFSDTFSPLPVKLSPLCLIERAKPICRLSKGRYEVCWTVLMTLHLPVRSVVAEDVCSLRSGSRSTVFEELPVVPLAGAAEVATGSCAVAGGCAEGSTGAPGPDSSTGV